MTVTVVGGYGTRAEPPKLSSRAAKVARKLRSRTPAQLYVYDTLLGWPQQNHFLPCQGRWNSENSGSAAAITRAGVVMCTGERSHGFPMKGRWSAGDTEILTG